MKGWMPSFIENIPVVTRNCSLTTMNPYRTSLFCEYLKHKYNNHFIGHDDDSPPRSPDFDSLDYFLGAQRTLAIYKTPIYTDE